MAKAFQGIAVSQFPRASNNAGNGRRRLPRIPWAETCEEPTLVIVVGEKNLPLFERLFHYPLISPIRISEFIFEKQYIHEGLKVLQSVLFINEDFFRWARPHKGMRRGVLYVRRSRKPAENAAQRKKDRLWMDTD